MKISVFEVETWERETFQHLADRHGIRFEDSTGAWQPNADADTISTFIYSSLDAGVLSNFDDLKLIATRSTGFDHIDTNWCQDHAVTITNVPTYGRTPSLNTPSPYYSR